MNCTRRFQTPEVLTPRASPFKSKPSGVSGSDIINDYFGNAAACMPKTDDLNQVVRTIEAIDDAIRSNNNFASQVIAKLRYDSAKLRKLGKGLRVGNKN